MADPDGYTIRCVFFIREFMIMNHALELLLPDCARFFQRRLQSSAKKQLSWYVLLNQHLSGTGKSVRFSPGSIAVGNCRMVLAKTSISQIAHQARRLSSIADHWFMSTPLLLSSFPFGS
jgi:hypothetical protein